MEWCFSVLPFPAFQLRALLMGHECRFYDPKGVLLASHHGGQIALLMCGSDMVLFCQGSYTLRFFLSGPKKCVLNFAPKNFETSQFKPFFFCCEDVTKTSNPSMENSWHKQKALDLCILGFKGPKHEP